jgi:ribosomal protein L25 (general stress protein Ctc)
MAKQNLRSPEEIYEIDSMPRTEGENPRQVRAAGFVTATIYGKNFPSESFQLPNHELWLALRHGHRRFKLKHLNKVAKVQQLQTHSVTRTLLNLEFMVEA